MKQQRETGNVDRKPMKRSWRKIDPEKLKAYIKERPDAFFHEIALEFGSTGEGIRKACRRHKITIKKSDRVCGAERESASGIPEENL